ncbi:Afi1 domain-containing protein/SPA domain-containing protein [Cephalotus follicularis]|uniref:Afi1 domain-containing protein/SPA domain-containing protein n=1 Tax=Cephalotus follicularis TaxID=3775 RepID=A0A1Q3DA71_CEPFO|nr:Afi1 domain-containing protein/SPA domain-containing protein [Cephalotus follicularis]
MNILRMSRSPSFKPELSLKPDPESLQRWVVAFCIIRFDLEKGQLIEESYPPESLTHDEELEVAFSSFPDSISQNQNRSSIHDCIFFFRLRRRTNSQEANVTSSESTETVDKEISSKTVEDNVGRRLKSISSGKGSRYLYGFVFNRQRHDERLKRGGEQKSVVILSHDPYSSVFRPLLQIMGPLYFDIGLKAIEHIAAYVSMWPSPVPGKLMELPIGNAMLKVNLPPAHCMPLGSGMSFAELASSMAPFLPNNQSIPQGLFHDSDLFGIFRGLLMQLWLLWELLLIGEPILIIAPTPPQCCEAVAGLVSLVSPLLYSVDFRPYFTIHDPEFSKLNSLQVGDTFPPMILGVTNLFFLKCLHNIPHIVSVGSPASNANRAAFASRSTGRISGKPEGFGLQQLSLKKFSPSSLLNAVKLRRDGPLCLMTEHKEAIWSTYAATTKPDTSILNRLIDAGLSPRIEESMSVVNNEILRRHFLELTTNFLAPFGPYFRTTTPAEGSSPFVDPPPLPLFNADEFLSSLSARGVGKFLSKRMRSNWLDLYRRFLKGPNFMPWFQRRRAVTEQEQHRLWRHTRMKTDIQQLISKMSELEIVDSFNAIEKHLIGEVQLEQSGMATADSAATCQKLKGDLQMVFHELPKDMQQLLLLNPERAAFLQGSPEIREVPDYPSLQVGSIPSSPSG